MTDTRKALEERFYIDCEFDGHNGQLQATAHHPSAGRWDALPTGWL